MALSERTRKFIMEVTGGVGAEEAASIARLPVEAVPPMLQNPAIRREIDIALADQGIDQKYFTGKLKELCEAEDAKGNPVWAARSKGLDMLKDIYGHDAPKKQEQTKTTYTYEERLLMIADEGTPGEAVKEITCDSSEKRLEEPFVVGPR